VKSNALDKPWVYSLLIIFFYGVAWIIELFVIGPLQNQIYFLSLYSSVASFIFLPHGIRTMAVVLYGLKALPAIFIASLLTGFFFLSIKDSIILSTITTISLFLTIKLFSFEKGYAYENITLKTIVLTAVASSIISSFLNSVYKLFITQNIDFVNLILTHTLGDFFGAIICFYIIGLFYFFLKKLFY
jgi:hypothetical protein